MMYSIKTPKLVRRRNNRILCLQKERNSTKKANKKRRKENQVDNHVRCKHISWSDYMIKHKFHKFIPNSKRAWKNSLQLSEILWKRNYKYLMIWKHVFGTIRLYWCDPLVESFFNLNYIWLYICINLISIPCV